jgi:hypothetical protein
MHSVQMGARNVQVFISCRPSLLEKGAARASPPSARAGQEPPRPLAIPSPQPAAFTHIRSPRTFILALRLRGRSLVPSHSQLS